MRDKDSDKIYQLYTESNLHCEALPAIAARAAAALPAIGRGIYKLARKGGVPKGPAKAIARYGPGAAGAAALTGDDDSESSEKGGSTSASDAAAGSAAAGFKKSRTTSSSSSTTSSSPPVPAQMVGLQLDKKTAQSLYDQLGRMLGRSVGIEKDPMPEEEPSDKSEPVDPAAQMASLDHLNSPHNSSSV